jgi:hypothetical protein
LTVADGATITKTLLLILALPTTLWAQTDTAAVRKELQRAASEYENTLRNTAPHRLMRSGYCDETVGRFCVIYDVGRLAPLPPEPERVKQARTRAIDAFRKAVTEAPGDSTLVAPLIRYLVEGDRAPEAVEVARKFSENAKDGAWADLLLGFAHHAARDDAKAEELMLRGLHLALPIERVQIHDVAPLLTREEQQKYKALPARERAVYQERLWNLSDPLFLTQGNESLVEHVARRVYARMLAQAPATDTPWGPDQEEMAVRFGVPTARTQNFGQGMGGKQLVEHYDPEQLTYVPPALLTKSQVLRFEPGAAWPFDTVRAFSGYAPRTFKRMQVLEHQVARFPTGDSVLLRADFKVAPDSVSGPLRVDVGLFALDSMYDVIAHVRDTLELPRSDAVANISLRMPPNAVAYSLETIEIGTGLASRARYVLPAWPRGRPTVSDVVIFAASEAAPPGSRADAAFRPLPSLVIKRDDAIGFYVEARGLVAPRTGDGLVRYRVDLEVLEQDRPGNFSRAVRRLGRALGLQQDDVAPRITWTQQHEPAAVVPIGLKLGKIQLEPGLKLFRVTVTDMATGGGTTVERLIRVR